jgi:hypothetical protein
VLTLWTHESWILKHKRSGYRFEKKWVRKLCLNNNLHFLGIQESKYNKDDLSLIHSLWGNQSCDFAIKKADGNSGGIIAIWNTTMFKNHNVIEGDGYLAIYGEWIHFKTVCLMIVVYAPQEMGKKCSLWNTLNTLIIRFNTPTVVLGDFNEVRDESERMGSLFCKRGAQLFNKFIDNSNLIDLPLGGRNFTRMNKIGTKLSKLDRFLVTQHFLSTWPNSYVTVLPRELSDHCPLILKTHSADYGPYPLKFFNSWMLNEDFTKVVTDSWSTAVGSTQATNLCTNQPIQHQAVTLKRKFQCLKTNIRCWRLLLRQSLRTHFFSKRYPLRLCLRIQDS